MVREASGPGVWGGVRSVGMGIPLLPRELQARIGPDGVGISQY